MYIALVQGVPGSLVKDGAPPLAEARLGRRRAYHRAHRLRGESSLGIDSLAFWLGIGAIPYCGDSKSPCQHRQRADPRIRAHRLRGGVARITACPMRAIFARQWLSLSERELFYKLQVASQTCQATWTA